MPRPEKLPRVKNHAWDWIEAIRTGRQAGSNFGYGGPLTQAALLGAIAIRFPGQTLKWDNQQARFTNNDAANAYVNPGVSQRLESLSRGLGVTTHLADDACRAAKRWQAENIVYENNVVAGQSIQLIALAGLLLTSVGSSLQGADAPKPSQEPPVVDPGPARRAAVGCHRAL